MKLTRKNRKTFFNRVEVGDIHTYSYTVMDWTEVNFLALDRGFEIEYNSKEFGMYAFKVLRRLDCDREKL